MVKEVLGIHRVDVNLNELKHQFVDGNPGVREGDLYHCMIKAFLIFFLFILQVKEEINKRGKNG